MLGVALDRYVEVEIEPAPSLEVVCVGEGADLERGERHLAVRVAQSVLGHSRIKVTVRSEIPVARGLGSSAAIAVAAAAACGSERPLEVAASFDGHPDNAAASVSGGLVAVVEGASGLRVQRLPLDPSLVFVAVIPARELSTERAREVLPSTVPRADATFNAGRVALLVAGLADHRLLTPEATRDRLHQPQRAALFEEAPEILAALEEGGALAACWSGAGPTLVGMSTRERAGEVAGAARKALARSGVEGVVVELQADTTGVVVGEDARLPIRPPR